MICTSPLLLGALRNIRTSLPLARRLQTTSYTLTQYQCFTQINTHLNLRLINLCGNSREGNHGTQSRSSNATGR